MIYDATIETGNTYRHSKNFGSTRSIETDPCYVQSQRELQCRKRVSKLFNPERVGCRKDRRQETDCLCHHWKRLDCGTIFQRTKTVASSDGRGLSTNTANTPMKCWYPFLPAHFHLTYTKRDTPYFSDYVITIMRMEDQLQYPFSASFRSVVAKRSY